MKNTKNLDMRKPLAHTLSDETRTYLKAIGKIGGAAGTGAAKARTSTQARFAAESRLKANKSRSFSRKANTEN